MIHLGALILRQLARLRAMCCVTGSVHTLNLSPLSNDENWSRLKDPLSSLTD